MEVTDYVVGSDVPLLIGADAAYGPLMGFGKGIGSPVVELVQSKIVEVFRLQRSLVAHGVERDGPKEESSGQTLRVSSSEGTAGTTLGGGSEGAGTVGEDR